MSSIRVVKDSSVFFPGLPKRSFAKDEIIPEWSKYYTPMLWAGLATVTGLPSEPQNPEYEREYQATFLRTGTVGHGDTLQYDADSGVWRSVPSAVLGPNYANTQGPLWASLAQRATRPVRIVFLGSSTTAGLGASVAEKRWVNQFTTGLQRLYPNGGTEHTVQTLSGFLSTPSTTPGVQGINGGVSGTTSANFCSATHLYGIGVANPDAVVIMVGSNDSTEGQYYVSPAQYEFNVNKAVADIDALSVSGTPVSIVLIHAYRRFGVTEAVWDRYRQALLRIANRRKNVLFVDLAPAFEGARHISPDPYNLVSDADIVHPTDAGHMMIADLTLKQLRAA